MPRYPPRRRRPQVWHPTAGQRRAGRHHQFDGDSRDCTDRARRDAPTIPGYEILEVIGRGGMGVVYRARHLRLRRLVALKVILRDRLSPSSDAIQRFQREALASAQLFHPNVVVVFDADQVGETYFIAMEYVDGVDLHHLVKEQGPLPIDRACDFVRQTALGLQHAHECGLVHRDIKPSNLLVTVARQGAEAPTGTAGRQAWRGENPRHGPGPDGARSDDAERRSGRRPAP